MTRDSDLPIGVLLAGGLSRRMGGGDKSLRRLAGRTLLDHAIARLQPQVRRLILNANGDPARFAACGLPVVADPVPDHPGPMAGVLGGMLWARQHCPEATHIVTAPTDTPFLPADLVARLQHGHGGVAWAASAGRVHPAVALWPVALVEDLAAALAAGQRKLRDWGGRHAPAEVVFEAAEVDPFYNVNSPEELGEAERLVSKGGALPQTPPGADPSLTFHR